MELHASNAGSEFDSEVALRGLKLDGCDCRRRRDAGSVLIFFVVWSFVRVVGVVVVLVPVLIAVGVLVVPSTSVSGRLLVVVVVVVVASARRSGSITG